MSKELVRKFFLSCKKMAVDSCLLNEFVNQNGKKYIKRNHGAEHCYIVYWNPNYFATIIPQLVYAQGIKENRDIEVTVLTPRVDKNWKRFLSSFGVNQKVIKRNIQDIVWAVGEAVKLLLSKTSGEQFLHLQYKGIPVGECLYDHIIRTTSGQYTIETIGWKETKKVVWEFSYLRCMYRMFETYRPTFYLPYERCHIEGAWTIMAAYFGAHIIQCTANGRVEYLGVGSNVMVRWHDVEARRLKKNIESGLTTDYKSQVYSYLEKRFDGKTGNIDVANAYGTKPMLSRVDFIVKYGLDGYKKNVLIMPHVFSDEPHGSEKLLYRDYYQWYVETLKIISKIESVNWIVKAHPSRGMYNEGEEVYDLFLEYKTDSMFWFPEEYSTKTVLELADVILTVQGTVGIEYGCMGKPIVLTGKAYYAGFGYTIEPQTKEEYRKVLQELYQIEPLNEQQKDMACKVLYQCINKGYEPYDDFDRMLTASLTKSVYDGNNEVLNGMLTNYLNDSSYYETTKFYQIAVNMTQDTYGLQIGECYEASI